MSQTKIKAPKQRHTEVKFSLGEVRENAAMGSEGIKAFLEFYADEPDDRTVICDLSTGALKLDGAEMPEAKSEVAPLVN